MHTQARHLITQTEINAITKVLSAKLDALNEAEDIARVDLWEFAELLQDLAANVGASYVDRLTVKAHGPWLEGVGSSIGNGTASFRVFVAAKRLVRF